MQIEHIIAQELSVDVGQVKAAVGLLDEGSTVPFIARYRKEVTGGLDDTQLRNLAQRLGYLRELFERRDSILRSIGEQEKLTPELTQKIMQAQTKTALEDLYLPYKPKRRTKGQIAIEAGLAPLAATLYNQANIDPDSVASNYLQAEGEFSDLKAVLDGAKYILMEQFAEDAELLAKLRTHLHEHALMLAKVITGKEQEGEKYQDYFAYQEAYQAVPSHRALAMFRGRTAGILALSLSTQPDLAFGEISDCEALIAQHTQINLNDPSPRGKWLASVVQWTWKIKLNLHLESELFNTLRKQAESEAIKVFAQNLQDLLMAAPAGPKVTMGLDPGLRTGVKVAVVDNTGKTVDTATIYPHAPQKQWDKALRTLVSLAKQHKVELLAIGNGTASRETDMLAAEVLKTLANGAQKIIVSEAGASVYSASELASQELPTLDVSLRGAVSIARRLQDPLAELVKIDPKAIGVGQYQHDVSQVQLSQSLAMVIEDCVNKVGVDVNMASPALLSYVSGLNKTLAQNIVAYRNQNGAFSSRKALLEVPRLGAKAFEQAAGFLRIRQASNPLDASAVHPETYPVVEQILADLQVDAASLIGNQDILRTIEAQRYTNAQFGLPTINDILQELNKPGRDPRPEFKTAKFNDAVQTVNDLIPGMVLEGVVSNVANFGAFVDIGVHQDGLVHISALTNKFVKDPREVVKTGDLVKVKVIEVDVKRKRISLSMRLDDDVSVAVKAKPQAKSKPETKARSAPSPSGGMADAFAAALNKKK